MCQLEMGPSYYMARGLHPCAHFLCT